MTYSKEEQRELIHKRLVNDFEFFAENVLTIKDKNGEFIPFQLNRAQKYLHERLEEQKRRTGMVRAIIVKGRQQGCSTYVSARYYKHALHNSGKSVYILSHEAASTEKLFAMVQRYLGESPEPARPQMEVLNQRQMKMKNNSEYSIGTAGAGTTGRSQTNQYFHGSEVAFWETSAQLVTGVLQTVADIEGTEIILESTANGIGNFFHRKTMESLEGKGVYEVIFIPWYWQPEYTAPPKPDFVATEGELELVDLYGLTDGQLQWRRNKISDLGESMFKQEYPFTVEEAFQSSGDSLISATAVQMARKQHTLGLRDTVAPIVIGVDPARKGDRTIIVVRRGRQTLEIQRHTDMDEMRLTGITSTLIDKYRAKKCFIDIASGAGTYDRLRELGYEKVVTCVHFGSKPMDPRFLNKRVEMAFAFKEWLEGGLLDDPVSIPDDEDVATDILAIPDYKQSSTAKILLVSKDEIRKTYGKSTDIFDAFILTFAFPVKSDTIETAIAQRREKERRNKGRSLTLAKLMPKRPGRRDRYAEEDY